MIELDFEGWWQCRFATDPDPTDDPHGVSGPTFTVAGEQLFTEPVVRLQDPVDPRYPHADDVAVDVRAVKVGGEPVPEHPLVGAAVSLEGGAQFMQRNFIYPTPAPFALVIDPFDLQVANGDIVLRRKALWDVTHPDVTYEDVFLDMDRVTPRLNQMEIASVEVAEATGVMDYAGARNQRAEELRKILAGTTDPTARLGLEKRIRAIEADRTMTGQQLAATAFMGMKATWTFDLDGPPLVKGEKQLGGRVGRSQLWPLEFWLGGYDVDTMCGYMRGTLSVPFHAEAT